MAKVGRPPLLVPTVAWKLKIPVPIAVELDMLVFDPVKGINAYGQRSALVTQILREYLERRKLQPPELPDGVDKLDEG